MKKLIQILSLALLVQAANAQKIKVSESSEKIGGGSNNALVVSIYEATPEEIEKEWRSVMKKYDAKVSSADGIFADNAVIKAMGNNTVDVYAKTEKAKDGETKFIVAFDLGGAFLSSSKHSSQYGVAKDIVNEFAIRMTKESIAGQMKAAVKVMEKLKDKEQDLVKDNEKLNGNITDLKERIKKAEDEIVKNKSELEKKKIEISAQQKVVDGIDAKQKAVN